MNSEEQKHAAEQWLDDALAHYSAAEPRAGIETRILANLEAHVSQRRRRWILAFSVSAAVVVFAMLVSNVLSFKKSVPPNNAGQTSPLEVKFAHATQAAALQRQGENLQLSTQPHATVHKPATVLHAIGMKQNPFPVDRPLFRQVAQHPPAPSINISDLKTIQAIEVRELAPIKEMD